MIPNIPLKIIGHIISLFVVAVVGPNRSKIYAEITINKFQKPIYNLGLLDILCIRVFHVFCNKPNDCSASSNKFPTFSKQI